MMFAASTMPNALEYELQNAPRLHIRFLKKGENWMKNQNGQITVTMIALTMLGIFVALMAYSYHLEAPQRAKADDQTRLTKEREAQQKQAQAEETRIFKEDEIKCNRAAVTTAATKLKDLLGRFRDASELASSTSRIALSGPVATLQQIKREVESTEVPECMTGIRQNFAHGVVDHTQGFLYFMRSDSIGATSSFETSIHYVKLAADELRHVSQCAPHCRNVAKIDPKLTQ
jgi:hypothetical protein